ncbi:tripartite tricarboxylate transporter substrate binding protein [Siccirubricoccus sp. KC 17139]|uniref:Tripartite tricarboxylate transporter substrate binding protein n=1 Tax=Siccirubricoccus soli TaxID=2899147 RepID=A0ABT1D278_9PROT|nr:tripartite tricarboxylate transporter substrate binding protein [Siccirubricoccus soli]MCO6416011.1 tripartite tricarboxylate transporter substrate binding protein [Siccirubricoccus soli]MCP2682143.1 tripartite tricarboxylate transporter substrate binding protein [Siccirubricoccus soli]
MSACLTLRRRALLGAGGGALLGLGSARGQDGYPGQRPVSLVIPYAAGGIPDVFGNAIVRGLTERLGGTFVMDHKPGASTTLGARLVARARPDGYTLVFAGNGTFSITPFVLRNAGYDPAEDFTWLGMTGSAMYLFVAHPRWESLQALLIAAHRRPGEISYATWGVGSSAHLGTFDLARRAGVDLVHVPYNGTAAALTDVSTGRVDFMLSTLAPAKPHMEAGRVRALGVAMPARYRLLPEVPTVAEQGFPGYDVPNWTAVAGPAGLPASVATKLEGALAATFADEQVMARLEPLGITPAPTGAQALRETVARDLAANGDLVRRAGIAPE